MLATVLPLLIISASAFASPQDYRTTPVPILKQINRHNDDGSYSYGYEAADGTFKIETKYPTGEVFGKYGYVGDDGKVRQVEYGASKRGFEPVGSGINVPPPTLTNSVEDIAAEHDDGQYREDPSIYYKETSEHKSLLGTRSGAKTAFKTSFQTPQTRYHQPTYYQSQPQFRPQSQYFIPRPRFQPIQITYDPLIFSGHPATNFDLNTGSYTISYTV